MKPLTDLGASEVSRLRTIAFDLDDTLLDHSELGLEAATALFRLRALGLRLVAITGRPAGWAELAARFWPIHWAIGENGAVLFRKHHPGRVERVDLVPGDARASRDQLARIVAELRARFPELEPADDNHLRATDTSFDIGEHRSVPLDRVAIIRAEAEALGARTTCSRIHLHVTLSTLDKASGFARAAELGGEDPPIALSEAAYVGDSLNDEPAFAAFGLPIGVANVARYAAMLRVPPRFVASREAGLGFAEIAARIVDVRGSDR